MTLERPLGGTGGAIPFFMLLLAPLPSFQKNVIRKKEIAPPSPPNTRSPSKQYTYGVAR